MSRVQKYSFMFSVVLLLTLTLQAVHIYTHHSLPTHTERSYHNYHLDHDHHDHDASAADSEHCNLCDFTLSAFTWYSGLLAEALYVPTVFMEVATWRPVNYVSSLYCIALLRAPPVLKN